MSKPEGGTLEEQITEVRGLITSEEELGCDDFASKLALASLLAHEIDLILELGDLKWRMSDDKNSRRN